MGAPSWTTDSNSPTPTGTPAYQPPSFLNDVVAAPAASDGSGIVNSAKATVEGLERGFSGGLSDKFQDALHKASQPKNVQYGDNPYLNEALGTENAMSVLPDLSSGSPEDRAARTAANPLKSKLAEATGHTIMTPVSSTLDALGVPDGPKILPENKYLNPTYGGVAKGLGDIVATAPETALKALAGMRPMLESMAGLVGPQAKAWIENPELVTKIKNALESQKLSGIQDLAGGQLKDTIDQLKQRGMTRADVGSKMLEGHSVPYATEDLQTLADKGSITAKKLLTQAQEQIAQKAAETGTSAPVLANAMPQITASGPDIYALTQDAGRTFQESGGIHPLTGAQVPKDANLGRIWQTSRNNMANLPGVGPTVDTLMKRTRDEAQIQGALSPKVGSDTPLTILNTSSPDQLARLDQLANAGMPELQDTGNAWQAAKNISKIEYGRGAPGIAVPLHGVSPKAQFISQALNSLTGGLPQKAALGLLPLSELGKTSPWMSLDSVFNPITGARIIENTQKEK